MTARRGHRGFGHIRKLPSGRWQASFVAPDPRRVNAPVTFVTKADAEGWLGAEHRKIADGAWERPKPPEPPRVLETFGDYAKTWVATRDIKPGGGEYRVPRPGALGQVVVVRAGPVRLDIAARRARRPAVELHPAIRPAPAPSTSLETTFGPPSQADRSTELRCMRAARNRRLQRLVGA